MKSTCGSVAAPPHLTHPETSLGIYPNWDPNPALPRSQSNQSRGSTVSHRTATHARLYKLTPPWHFCRSTWKLRRQSEILESRYSKYLDEFVSWIANVFVPEDFDLYSQSAVSQCHNMFAVLLRKTFLPHQSSHSRSRQVTHTPKINTILTTIL